MILVVGATGLVGSEICRMATEQRRPVRGLVRSLAKHEKREGLRKMGVQIMEGDLTRPQTLRNALDDVDVVIVTASSMPSSYVAGENDIRRVDVEGAMALVDAAARNGVRHLIYASVSGHLDLHFPLLDAKRLVEDRLKRSGMTYTILRPTFFMESWLSPERGFDFPHSKARLWGRGNQAANYISYHDVATFAVACIDHPSAVDAAVELGGPDRITPLEVVQIFEDVSGARFDVEYVPEDVLIASMHETQDPMERSIAGLMACAARGIAVDMADTTGRYGIDLKSVRDYARETLHTGRRYSLPGRELTQSPRGHQ